MPGAKRSTRPSTFIILILLVIGLIIAVAVTISYYRTTTQPSATTVQLYSPPGRVIEQLPITTVVSNQLLNLVQPYPQEYATQQAGSADSYPEPITPIALQASNTRLGNSVIITWSIPIDQTVSGIELYRSTKPKAHDTIVAELSADTSEYLDTEVTSTTTYYYSARSYRTINDGVVYSDFTETIAVTPADDTPPPPPTDVRVERKPAAPNILIVHWTKVETDAIVSYRVYRSITVGEVGALLAEVEPDYTQLEDTTATPAQMYYYTVTAVDTAGHESTQQLPVAPIGNANPFVVKSS
ncbi:MAG: hypothetical protein HYV33_01365 [Candidatus Kerfeldbacteria bacterium]|nr:hypothetical protein [Candidatus Kerfeldbacteria bacterium]